MAEAAAKPKKTTKKVVKEEFCAVGRRKTSSVRVKVFKGTGEITINDKNYDVYVSMRDRLMMEINKPFKVANLMGIYDVDVNAQGGGIASQAEAIKLGIARALVLMDETLRSAMGKAGCLIRDSRMKERKKYGRKRARRRFQYSKR